jgi:hypothetical protein
MILDPDRSCCPAITAKTDFKNRFQDLKRRIRKIPGVPIMYIANHRYAIERMPDAYGDKTAF